MGTQCAIVEKIVDDYYRYIICFYDGYPEHALKILNKHYTSESDVNKLLSLGDISSLGETVGTKHNFDNSPDRECNAYHRDREEPWEDVKTKYGKINDITDCCSYIYVYNPEKKKWKQIRT